MTERRERSVLFVGAPKPVNEMLSGARVSRGIRTCTVKSTDECRRLLDTQDCDLLVIDLDGDKTDGLVLLVELGSMSPPPPIIALVDDGDISTAVKAIKAGADNCLQKPINTGVLKREIQTLLEQTAENRSRSMGKLTPVEKTVLRHILAGQTNGQTARILHRSPRTIEVHRRHIMRKLGVSGMVGLVRVASTMGLFDATDG